MRARFYLRRYVLVCKIARDVGGPCGSGARRPPDSRRDSGATVHLIGGARPEHGWQSQRDEVGKLSSPPSVFASTQRVCILSPRAISSSRGILLPIGTAFHERTFPLCHSLNY